MPATARSIVLATDLSPIAVRTYAPATALARALGLRLVLLHVVHDPVLAPALASNPVQQAAAARAELDRAATGLGLEGTAVDVRAADDVAAAILAAAGEHGAAYLALAAHGRSGLQRLRLGSVANALIRRSAIPLVCFPAT
jgi:nucleotide-binding universal stress UspA family protein